MRFLPRTPLDLLADLLLMAVALALLLWLWRGCA